MFDDNATFLTTDRDEDGSKYRANFELYPYVESEEYALFKGKQFGEHGEKGARHAEICTVRTLRNSHPRFQDWDFYMMCSKQAALLAAVFNKLLMPRTEVRFSLPLRAEMDTAWNANSIIGFIILAFRPHRKRLKEDEVVVVEDFLGKTTSLYISDSGFVGPNESDILQAFGHFTWNFTNERLVICGLRGVRRKGHFRLSDPTIHSVSSENGSGVGQDFGPRDKGLDGIISFFRYHRCNDICRNMPTPTALYYS
ncbi:eukaryotic elongation factor 2 kinase-like [Haliotis rufescens]|uniref:eukaryotic elongation factor 2 kinase-like n=1 Tax=Haliotis rufescens TaxID=6454 RepID=UPI00201ED0D5|nr:eukaryotic elongation factor 2 kinase-like [Haliotis rufescens]